MSLRTTLRALPTVIRVAFAEAVAYRAEMFVWFLSTTMPLVMLAMWSAVARDHPVGRFGEREFSAYFMTIFIVRQIASAWIGWQMNFEVRQGALSMRLLRPLPPPLAYAIENLAAMPMRLVLVAPVVALTLGLLGTSFLPDDPLLWAMVPPALAGAWLLAFLTQFCIGALSLFMQSSLKMLDVWFITFTLTSGYLFPLELLPDPIRRVLDLLPFRFLLAFPVELLNDVYDRSRALALLVSQWCWVGGFAFLAWLVWTRGLRRFAAYGG